MIDPASRRLTVRIDPHRCVGSTMCIQYSPKVFGLDEKRQSRVIDPSGDTVARILAAAEQCPLNAIIVEDADTGEPLFP